MIAGFTAVFLSAPGVLAAADGPRGTFRLRANKRHRAYSITRRRGRAVRAALQARGPSRYRGRLPTRIWPTATVCRAHLLQARGEYKVESAMQELAILFETDRRGWFAAGPGIFGDLGIVLEIKLCGERDMQ